MVEHGETERTHRLHVDDEHRSSLLRVSGSLSHQLPQATTLLKQAKVAVDSEEASMYNAGRARGRSFATSVTSPRHGGGCTRWLIDEDICETALAILELLDPLGGSGAE